MYVSGGLNPESEKAQDHAIKMYESIRKRRSDYEMISKNTGFSIEQIQIVKNYISIQGIYYLIVGTQKDFMSHLR